MKTSPEVIIRTERAKTIGRRYMVQIVGWMLLYTVVLVVSLHVLRTHTLSPVLRILVGVAPALPTFGVVAAVFQFMLNIDELQRQIHLEAFAIAAGLTAACAVTYGFLENAGLPCPEGWWTFVTIDVFWGLSLPFVSRRYC
jgi:hypothetical protein